MKYYFTEEQKANGQNRVEIEDVLLTVAYVEKVEDDYRLTGVGIVEGETYPEFVVQMDLVEPITDVPEENMALSILEAEWDTYDFIFTITE